MNYKIAGVGKWKCIIIKPHDWAYGHLALEILMALNWAKREGRAVYFITPDRVGNKYLLKLQTSEVNVLSQSLVRSAFFRMVWAMGEYIRAMQEAFRGAQRDIRSWMRRCRRVLMRECRVYAKQRILGDRSYPRELRELFKQRALHIYANTPTESPSNETTATHQGPYYRRSLIREPIQVRLPPELAATAAERARMKWGLAAPNIVTWHVRESGYKSAGGHQENSSDQARNARVEDYYEAVDSLVSMGYQVVRLGDPFMTPVKRSGVVDLATSSERDPLLETWCLLNSHFLLGCDSGPYAACILAGIPALIVNATNPINSYPVRANSMYILKHVVDRMSGTELTLDEMLSEEYLSNWRNPVQYRYKDNTSEEISLAAREMLEFIASRPPESPMQREYKAWVLRQADELKTRIPYIRKWGIEGGFLGDGRIAQFYIEANRPPSWDTNRCAAISSSGALGR